MTGFADAVGVVGTPSAGDSTGSGVSSPPVSGDVGADAAGVPPWDGKADDSAEVPAQATRPARGSAARARRVFMANGSLSPDPDPLDVMIKRSVREFAGKHGLSSKDQLYAFPARKRGKP
ncbi:hypothetical protein GCM10023193_49020 [Planotetraspora kaengkrachanensis]|uniref:Uncharacterized protein n=1 Tax=Planotetraspora kaengkrachanensis TaxID=575193 RepID=A0A8J3PWC5_9ACTN|nr:hypothetical protein Pka01_54410 [Planotetraspora kaengkrachanensis]